jgi:hypothetical protein
MEKESEHPYVVDSRTGICNCKIIWVKTYQSEFINREGFEDREVTSCNYQQSSNIQKMFKKQDFEMKKTIAYMNNENWV